MRPARGSDDADIIRARLRALLDDGRGGGWVPEELAPEPPTSRAADPAEDAPRAADPDDVDPVDPDDVDPDDGDPGTPGSDPAAEGRHRAGGPVVRLDPGRPGARALWIAAAAAVLVLLALTWWHRPAAGPVLPAASSAAPEAGSPAVAPPSGGDEAPPTRATVVVSVVGRVARPGLVTLPEGARVADALEAAGGLLPGAEAAGVNLAALLADGQQVAVGVPGADPPPGSGGAPAGAAGRAVDLNAAGAAELEVLPGLGPVLAQRIVDHRAEHGPFTAVEDLLDVPGIGPAILDGLADAATV